jgi:hypothetical protein
MTEHIIGESDEAMLKTALKLHDNDDLPKEIIELYWEAERTARRLRAPLSHHELVLICLLANRATRPDPISFLDRTDLKVGARVLAKFRNSWRWGKLVRIDQQLKKVIVSLDDDNGADERTFAPTNVVEPSFEELKKIGEVK